MVPLMTLPVPVPAVPNAVRDENREIDAETPSPASNPADNGPNGSADVPTDLRNTNSQAGGNGPAAAQPSDPSGSANLNMIDAEPMDPNAEGYATDTTDPDMPGLGTCSSSSDGDDNPTDNAPGGNAIYVHHAPLPALVVQDTQPPSGPTLPANPIRDSHDIAADIYSVLRGRIARHARAAAGGLLDTANATTATFGDAVEAAKNAGNLKAE
eukprot:g6460.t1